MVFEALTQKNEAKTAQDYLELNAEFPNRKLQINEDDPDKWFTHLHALRTRMNEVVIVGKSMKTKMDLILHILSAVPEAYENQVQRLESLLLTNAAAVNIKIEKDDF